MDTTTAIACQNTLTLGAVTVTTARRPGDVFAKVMILDGAGPTVPEFFEGVDQLDAAVARAQELTDLGARHVVVEATVVGADRWTTMFMDPEGTRGTVGTWRGWIDGIQVGTDVDAAEFLAPAPARHPMAGHTMNCRRRGTAGHRG